MKNLAAVIALACALMANSLAAQDDCVSLRGQLMEAMPDMFSVLQQLHELDCLGSAEDTAGWVREVWEMRPEIDDSTSPEMELEQRRAWALAGVEAALAQARQIGDTHQAVRSQLVSALEAAQEQLGLAVPPQGVTAPVRWQLQGRDGTVRTVPELRLEQTVEAACPGPPAQPQPGSGCAMALAYAERVLRIVALVQRGMQFHADTVIEAYRDRYTVRDRMWEAYRDQALPQYPWEWGINSWRMSRADDRPRDAAGEPMGPMEIPDDQIIFLHPGVGLERLDVDGDDATTDPTLYLEFIGYNRWQWDQRTGAMQGGLGVSLIGSVTRRDDADDFSYGVMFHWRSTFRVAVTRTDDATGILLGVDLAEMFRDKLPVARDVVDFW